MKRTEILPSVHYLEPESMRNFSSCAGMIITRPVTIVIDTAMGKEETAALMRKENPDLAVASHYHLDHGTWLVQAFDEGVSRLYVPEGEAPYFESMDHFLANTVRPYGLDREWSDFMVNTTGYRELSGLCTYNGNSDLAGDGTLLVIPTPGHSPSHCSFYLPGDGVLFTGDMGIDPYGPWYGWTECDLTALTASLLTLRSLDAKVLLTSHGGLIDENTGAAVDRCIDIILEREQRICGFLEQGREREEIVREGIYYTNKDRVNEPMRSFLYMWDDAMYMHHRELIDRGGIERVLALETPH